MTVYFIDGQFTEREGLTISIDDRGYYFGDGVYEVIKVYDGELYTAEEHINRLFQSATKIKMTIPYAEVQLMEIARELVEKNNIVVGHVYIQVTRGSAPRIHHFPNPSVPPVVTGYAINNPRPIVGIENGVAVKSVADVRWLRCDIKSLNLLGNVLAKQEAHEAGCIEALLHRDGVVTEGSSSNMFGVKDGIVYTHPVTNLILNGITRQVLLGLCEEQGIPVVEKSFTLDEAFAMDEFFLTSTTSEVMPVISIDGHPVSSGVIGPLTMKLQKAFNAQIPSFISGE
ncbi:D-amino-acid transaminase [Sporosarcina sp. ANT_H38]|uniref:D-amino-acid transaminase n=1 Tax=Sporosarcina sp. ANT_H38 TaxID=2597358 RepID=UPI0011F2E95F|nr:D-amino-acid transaminase [Sporosarcina sp. ANT_H38]KAA0965107.1 D-amino-acid transaminase [Sporosarcina sp. ANT_H38]